MLRLRAVFLFCLCAVLALAGGGPAWPGGLPGALPADVAAALEFLGPAGERLAGKLRLGVRLDVNGVPRLTARLERVEVEWQGVKATVRAQALVALRDDEVSLRDVRVLLEDASLDYGGTPVALPSVRLNAEHAVYAGGSLRVQGVRLAAGGLVELAGQGEYDTEHATVELAGEVLDLNALAGLLRGFGVDLPAGVSVRGRAGLAASWRGGTLRAVLEPRGAALSSGQALGGWGLENVSGQAELSARQNGGSGWIVNADKVDLGCGIAKGQAKVPGLRLHARGRVLPAPNLRLGLDGPLTAQGHWYADGGVSVATLRDMSLRLEPWLPLAGVDADGWLVSGRVSGRGRVVFKKNLAGELALGFSGLDFVSPNGVFLGQSASGSLLVRAGPENGAVFAELDAAQGEILYDTLYADLAKAPLHGVAQGTLADTSLAGLRAELAAAGFGTATAKGGVDWSKPEPAVDLKVDIRDVDLAKVSGLVFPQPAAAGNAMRMAGRAGFAGTVRGQGLNQSVTGRLRVQKGALPPVAQGLELDLPVDYRLGRTVDDPREPGTWGSLTVRGLRLPVEPDAPAVDLDLGVALAPNRLFVRDGLELPLLGGRLRLSDLAVDGPLSPDFRAMASAQVDGLDLARIPAGVDLRGRLSGVLPRLELSGQRLRVSGGLQGQLFGGGFTVRNLEVERPLSAGRVVSADADLRLMDLEPFSAALGVGRITGRMSLSLNDLSVAYGQPVGFGLRAWTVPVDDVDQTISLKAINSLAVLGTGSGLGDAGVGFFASFLKRFPYKAIGLLCFLDNDLFTVRGLIREGGVEYIVRKPPFFGVNVVNGNPSNRISFGDMLDRLARVVSPTAAPVAAKPNNPPQNSPAGSPP